MTSNGLNLLSFCLSVDESCDRALQKSKIESQKSGLRHKYTRYGSYFEANSELGKVFTALTAVNVTKLITRIWLHSICMLYAYFKNKAVLRIF